MAIIRIRTCCHNGCWLSLNHFLCKGRTRQADEPGPKLRLDHIFENLRHPFARPAFYALRGADKNHFFGQALRHIDEEFAGSMRRSRQDDQFSIVQRFFKSARRQDAFG